MSRLTRPPIGLPSDSVAPHNARLLGDKVLLSNDGGRTAILSAGEYRRYLAGLPDSDALWDLLRPSGFDRKRLDFPALGEARAQSGWAGWKGPSLFAIELKHGKDVMPRERLRKALEFAFSTPAPTVEIELLSDAGESIEGLVDFACAYSARLAEWSGRPVDVCFHLLRGELGEEMTDVLSSRSATFRRLMHLNGKPKELELYMGRQRVLAVMSEKSSNAAGWISSFVEAGVASVRLEGENIPFFAAALDEMLVAGPVEEWTAAALSRIFAAEKSGRPLMDEGWDFLSELAVSCDGTVRSSRRGWALGRVESLSLASLAAQAASAMDSLEADFQPMCFHCAYKPFCRIAPSENLHLQGSIWGRMPDSAACKREMGRYDALFERLMDEGKRAQLEKWLAG